MSSIDITELKELFKKNIVLDIDDLMKQTSSSKITVFRNLKDIGYTTSYNHNGKYYTLLETAKFDESGIFDHKGILFFRHGGIQELVIKEIKSSEKGYTAEELRNKIRTRVSNQLHQFVSKGLIIRKKYADFYVYYSIDDTTQQKQISNREKELKIPSTKEESEISSEKKTIRILLEIIQNPKAQPYEIGKILRHEGLKISDSFIQNIFEKYDIQKKGYRLDF
jgi:predicted transcriptional regulator